MLAGPRSRSALRGSLLSPGQGERLAIKEVGPGGRGRDVNAIRSDSQTKSHPHPAARTGPPLYRQPFTPGPGIDAGTAHGATPPAPLSQALNRASLLREGMPYRP